MTLLFVDGFSHYVTADIAKKYTTTASGPEIGTGGRRAGTGRLELNTTFRSVTKSFSNAATVVLGAAVMITASPAANSALLVLQDVSSTQVKVNVDVDGTLRVYRGTGTTNLLGSSSAGALPLNTWTYIEFKANIHASTGTIEVRVNGVAVITLTGQNTRATANAYCNAFALFGAATNTYVNDLYFLNSSGSTNNDFLGDVRIDTLYPTSDGNYAQFTPSTGSTHYTLVDETAPNTSDYNDGATVGHRDSYGMGNLTALSSQTVFGLQVNAAILKDDAGAKSASTMVRSGSTDSDGTGVALSTSQVYLSQIYEQDPAAAAAWTETTVNGMEAGVKVTA